MWDIERNQTTIGASILGRCYVAPLQETQSAFVVGPHPLYKFKCIGIHAYANFHTGIIIYLAALISA